ncbi:MAG: quercetin 2,3-dioxygenase [Deltaproteobacteria bacterium]|nr:quercetin 2,3-dioxygenase [Deltaproteobacteria bacterium]
MTTSQIINQPGGDKSFWVLGDLYAFKVVGEETNGNYSVVEILAQQQNGPPPHIHHREDEGFYVLDGEFSFLYIDRTFTATAGSFVHIPKGTLHTFNNVGTAPGRVLVIITPAGLEKLFEEIGEPVTDMSSPPPFNPATIEKLLVLAPKYQLEIINIPPNTL